MPIFFGLSCRLTKPSIIRTIPSCLNSVGLFIPIVPVIVSCNICYLTKYKTEKKYM